MPNAAAGSQGGGPKQRIRSTSGPSVGRPWIALERRDLPCHAGCCGPRRASIPHVEASSELPHDPPRFPPPQRKDAAPTGPGRPKSRRCRRSCPLRWSSAAAVRGRVDVTSDLPSTARERERERAHQRAPQRAPTSTKVPTYGGEQNQTRPAPSHRRAHITLLSHWARDTQSATFPG